VLLSNFVDGTGYIPAENKRPYIIMTGNFESFQNYYGLKWFLEEVWSKELAEITELYLLGRGSAHALAGISGERRFDRIRIIDRENEILEYLAGAKVSVVPLWHGSGTRLKCIEAMAIRTQLVSTSIGAEGIDHRGSILIGDTPERFREQIIRVLKGETDHTEQALQVFNEKYSAAVIGQQLDRVISSLLT
jgi:glycosyltransferase involved in cell wall biosynthesis